MSPIAEQALGADSPVSNLYPLLRGRAAEARRLAARLTYYDADAK